MFSFKCHFILTHFQISGISIHGKFHKVDWPPIPRFLVEKRRREKTEIAPAPLTMISFVFPWHWSWCGKLASLLIILPLFSAAPLLLPPTAVPPQSLPRSTSYITLLTPNLVQLCKLSWNCTLPCVHLSENTMPSICEFPFSLKGLCSLRKSI